MANRMLIDAAHPEETRVVVLRGSRVEEFDFESENKKQLRGNIYLAKVTRVEPSLQAAFVEYGGNRHGFLAFSEIHPDYYQIPMSDRQALLDAEATEPEEEEERKPRRSRRRRGGDRQAAAARPHDDETISGTLDDEGPLDEHAHDPSLHGDDAGGGHAADAFLEEGPRPGDEEGTTEGRFGAADADAPDAVTSIGDPTAALIGRVEHAGHGHEAADAPSTSVERTMEATGALADVTPADVTPTEGVLATFTAERAGASDATVESDRAAADDERAASGSVATPTSDAEVDIGSSEVAAPPLPNEGGHDDGRGEGDEDAGDERPRGGRGRRHHGRGHARQEGRSHDDEDEDEEEHVEHLGGDALEEIPVRSYRPRRQYKIQEVIKRRQVLLVQVVKEERGNKGAALTTYLSLAGRYSVLMPNTAKGGGISRKITDAGDRQRLKSIAQDLEVPDGMGVILRTAGASRTKPEVKRDFEYLMRMWETVRETTLKSQAPTLVYEEGSLIKRSIRDLYNKDIEEVVVSGEDAYREAKDFMRLLMPTHAKNVQPWRDTQPIFTKAGAEAQLDAMFSSHVT